MFIARSLAPAVAVVVTAGALAAPAAAAPPFNVPVCTKSGKELGSGHAPGLVKAAAHSPALSVCPTFPGEGGGVVAE